MMPKTSAIVELAGDLQAFAEECVRAGYNTDVAEVVLDALNEKRMTMLVTAIDEGIKELDAGLGNGRTSDEFIFEVCANLGLIS